MSITLVRHTSVAVEGLCYGRTEVPLADTFESEAEATRTRLPPGPWKVISSPATRCLRLARFFSEQVEIDDRLSELHFGAWEGLPWASLPREEVDLWAADFVCGSPPGGESFDELARRTVLSVATLQKRFPNENVVIVTHGGVIRALLATDRRLPLAAAFSIEVSFGGVYPYGA